MAEPPPAEPLPRPLPPAPAAADSSCRCASRPLLRCFFDAFHATSNGGTADDVSQPLMLPEVAVAALPRALSSAASSMVGVVPPTSSPDHVAQNPNIGDSDEVESRAGASTAEVESRAEGFSTCVSALTDAQISTEEDDMAGDGSTSLSVICAR